MKTYYLHHVDTAVDTNESLCESTARAEGKDESYFEACNEGSAGCQACPWKWEFLKEV